MSPRSLAEYSQYARILLGQKNWSGAASVAKLIREQFSDSPEGYFIGGVVAKSMAHFDISLKYLERALELDPVRYDAAVELAELYLSDNRFDECLKLLNFYEDNLKNSSFYLLRSSKIFTWLGLHERAWRAISLANELQPNTDTILVALAECAVLLGKVNIAEPIYKRLITKYPLYQKNHYEFSKLKRAEDYDHIEQMKAVLQESNLPSQSNIYLYYALGKELEDLGIWDEAFSYYEKGGASVLSTTDYSVDIDINVIDKVIELCSEEWLTDSGFSNKKAEDINTPIFIVGLPRTGTTLIERVLSSHADIESADETFFFPIALSKEIGNARFSEIDVGLVQLGMKCNLEAVASRYFNMVKHRLIGKKYFIDKYPLNFLLLGFIAKAVPHAKFIYLNRKPMDACFALYKQSYFKFSYSLDDLGKYYVAHDRLRKHWRAVLGKRVTEVSYEEFVNNPESSTRLLLDELGLHFDSSCLEFHVNSKASATASTLQVREKAHTRSVNKWTKFSKHLSELKQYLQSNNIEGLEEFKF